MSVPVPLSTPVPPVPPGPQTSSESDLGALRKEGGQRRERQGKRGEKGRGRGRDGREMDREREGEAEEAGPAREPRAAPQKHLVENSKHRTDGQLGSGATSLFTVLCLPLLGSRSNRPPRPSGRTEPGYRRTLACRETIWNPESWVAPEVFLLKGQHATLRPWQQCHPLP